MVACQPPGSGTTTDSQALTGDSVPTTGNVQPPRATPAPPFTNIDSATSQQVLQYAATLEFVDALARVDTATIVEGTRSALMRISPEVGTRVLTSDQLKQGRITARWMRSADSVRYPMRTMLGYIWTDSTPASGWRMLYFPSDPGIPRSAGGALAVEDVNNADGYPESGSYMMKSGGGPIPYSCYYTNRRWICPMTGGLTEELVERAYNTRR